VIAIREHQKRFRDFRCAMLRKSLERRFQGRERVLANQLRVTAIMEIARPGEILVQRLDQREKRLQEQRAVRSIEHLDPAE